MKRWLTNFFVLGLLCAGLSIGFTSKTASAAGDDDAVLQSDHAFVAALAKSDKAAAEKYFDPQIMWTNMDGETIGKAKITGDLPKAPLGDESSAQTTVRTYGQLAAVQVASGKVHLLRIWVKRPAGWRLLDYHEVKQADHAAAPGPSTNDCENPCKGVPYTPKNDAEKGILTSWGQLETAVTNHDPKAWTTHFLDEFVLISSGAPEPVTREGRVAQLSKPGVGPAPPQLAKTPVVRFLPFGDSVVMIAQANPYAGKPTHISRIWVKRDGIWKMAFSYQTTIQSDPARVPPKS